VLDFGISKALSGSSVEELSLTKTAALIGSPLYMAPEQMRSAKDVDTRADIWSLGAMLYEMLTGQPPYLGESIPQLCAALLHDDPIPLRQHRPEIPEGLDHAVLRCLMKDRNQRFPTVFELGRALLPFAHPESRIHVERAERVLRVSDATVSGLAPSALSPMTDRMSFPQSSQASTPAMSVPITPLAATPAAVMQPIEPTVNSWGQSGLSPAPKKRGALVIVGVVAALLAAIGGLLAARASSSADAKAPAPAASPSLEPKTEAKAEPKAEPAPEPVAPTPVASAVPAVTQAPSIAAAPAAPAPAPAALKPKPLAAAKPAPKKPEVKPEPAPPPASKPGGITDFGGRR
jgi:serine/threonine-protein kinase